jgi:hypothetical protein
MKSLIFIGVLIFSSSSVFSQTIEIPPVAHPFFDVIEWKGMGALLLSKDPNGTSKQVNITLIGEEVTSIWDQKFSPKDEVYYYISSDNARYVYFMDNLDLIDGKAYFSQLNSAGNVKSSSVFIGGAIKKLGSYNYDDLELINVVVTDKALVHHFRYNDKSTKSIREFATFITHHNFLCYAVELGNTDVSAFKDENIGYWDFIGFTEDRICFAAREKSGKSNGWSVKEYTSKGKEEGTSFVKTPAELLSIENIGFGTTGKYYLKERTTFDKGILSFINNKLYLVGGQRKSEGAELTLYEQDGDKWKELNKMSLNYFIEKKPLSLGIYPMNEGLGYHLDHNGYNKASIITFTKQPTSAHNTYTDRTIFNPSSVFNTKEKQEFSVCLQNKVLTFDTEQLNKEGSVKFELETK